MEECSISEPTEGFVLNNADACDDVMACNYDSDVHANESCKYPADFEWYFDFDGDGLGSISVRSFLLYFNEGVEGNDNPAPNDWFPDDFASSDEFGGFGNYGDAPSELEWLRIFAINYGQYSNWPVDFCEAAVAISEIEEILQNVIGWDGTLGENLVVDGGGDLCDDWSACNYDAWDSNVECEYAKTYYADTDGDGLGEPHISILSCANDPTDWFSPGGIFWNDLLEDDGRGFVLRFECMQL